MRVANQKGFTLLEMIVAIGVFTVVIILAAGALLSVMQANRQTQAQRTIVNNLNFAIDSMVRDIRVGTMYHCGDGAYDVWQDCMPAGDDTFAFEPSYGDPGEASDQIVYRLNNNAIERSGFGGAEITFVAVTSPEIVIERLQFYVEGSDPDDALQPQVVISVGGYAELPGSERVDINLQTTASQRFFDL